MRKIYCGKVNNTQSYQHIVIFKQFISSSANCLYLNNIQVYYSMRNCYAAELLLAAKMSDGSDLKRH